MNGKNRNCFYAALSQVSHLVNFILTVFVLYLKIVFFATGIFYCICSQSAEQCMSIGFSVHCIRYLYIMFSVDQLLQVFIILSACYNVHLISILVYSCMLMFTSYLAYCRISSYISKTSGQFLFPVSAVLLYITQ